MSARPGRGFTLIELLIVVAIIGGIAAIAIPNLLNAIQRARQKRTMADMRAIATAVESYAADRNLYPEAQPAVPAGVLGVYLEPTYTKKVPAEDGWSGAFLYETTIPATRYRVLSYGKDAVDSGPTSGPTTDFDDDIELQNGSFLTWPEGAQE
jgi:general secretion pathway protein G